jgi:glycosyltransferase involved in cell wall biosynthesis
MRVVILMSTYQGEQFVAEQIESILKQLPPDGRLLVRDDGSRDGTASIVRSFVDPRITLTCGPNIGFAQSFFTLMAATPDDAEMIMLSDQDDVWLPQKIGRAWEYLKDTDGVPTLYCSRQQLVDGNLDPIALSKRCLRPPSFQNALTENIVTGCTAAFNRDALLLALQIKVQERVYFHDWWLYLVITAFGKVIVDGEATILYRQHAGNAIGRGAGLMQYVEILRFMRKRSWVHIMYRQIEEFSAVYTSQLSYSQKKLLGDYFDPNKIFSVSRFIFSLKSFRQSLLGDILLRCLIIVELASGRGLIPHFENRLE